LRLVGSQEDPGENEIDSTLENAATYSRNLGGCDYFYTNLPTLKTKSLKKKKKEEEEEEEEEVKCAFSVASLRRDQSNTWWETVLLKTWIRILSQNKF